MRGRRRRLAELQVRTSREGGRTRAGGPGERSGVPVVRRGLVEVRVWEGLGLGRVEGRRLIEGELGLGRRERE